jgi:hypothetical protein
LSQATRYPGKRKQKWKKIFHGPSHSPVVDLSDLELSTEIVESCRRGDGDAFRVLYDLYKDKVYSISVYFFHGDEGLDTGSYLPYIVG